jgi:hypothetical protein
VKAPERAMPAEGLPEATEAYKGRRRWSGGRPPEEARESAGAKLDEEPWWRCWKGFVMADGGPLSCPARAAGGRAGAQRDKGGGSRLRASQVLKLAEVVVGSEWKRLDACPNPVVCSSRCGCSVGKVDAVTFACRSEVGRGVIEISVGAQGRIGLQAKAMQYLASPEGRRGFAAGAAEQVRRGYVYQLGG